MEIKRGGPNVYLLQERLNVHKDEARRQQDRLSYLEKQCPLDHQTPDNCWLTIATDLQQTQPVPKLNNQSAFYKKKVSKNKNVIISNNSCCINLTSKYSNNFLTFIEKMQYNLFYFISDMVLQPKCLQSEYRRKHPLQLDGV